MNKIIAVAVAGLLALAAQADYSYLYWNISSAEDSIQDFSYAQLLYSTDGGLNWAAATLGDTEYTKVGNAGDGVTDVDTARFSALDNSYTFKAAVYADEGADPIGESAVAAYGDVLGAIYANMGVATATASFAVSAVPEPTSGLLLLFGMAGLALRRKRGRDVLVASDITRGRDVLVASF